jgi:hypothetical protein
MWKMLIMEMKQPSSGRHRPATHPVLQFVGIISRASGLLADPAAPPPICRLRHVSFFPLPDQQCPCCPSCCLFVLSRCPPQRPPPPASPCGSIISGRYHWPNRRIGSGGRESGRMNPKAVSFFCMGRDQQPKNKTRGAAHSNGPMTAAAQTPTARRKEEKAKGKIRDRRTTGDGGRKSTTATGEEEMKKKLFVSSAGWLGAAQSPKKENAEKRLKVLVKIGAGRRGDGRAPQSPAPPRRSQSSPSSKQSKRNP